MEATWDRAMGSRLLPDSVHPVRVGAVQPLREEEVGFSILSLPNAHLLVASLALRVKIPTHPSELAMPSSVSPLLPLSTPPTALLCSGQLPQYILSMSQASGPLHVLFSPTS